MSYSKYGFLTNDQINGVNSVPAIINSPLSIAGDIWIHNGANDTRLPVDANGKVLTCDSVSAVGVSYKNVDHNDLLNKGTNTHTQIDSHISATSAHGVSGDIVGTGGNQTITGTKTFTGTINLNSTSTKTSSIYCSSTTLGMTNDANILTFPNATGTIALTSDIPSLASYVTLNGTEVLTNKTINSASNTLQVNGTNINSLIDQDVRTTASPTFGRPLTSSGITIRGPREYPPTQPGVYAGYTSNTSDMGVSICSANGSASARLDFTTPNIDYYGRISYDNIGQYMQFITDGIERFRISAAGLSITTPLALTTPPSLDNAQTQILARDSVSGNIVIRDNIVDTNTTQTLTNKTLTTPIISTISNTGTLTLPTGTRTLVARDTTDTLTNKTLTTPIISTISNTGTLTLPTSTDTLVGRATVDTLTNKTINSASNTLQVNGTNVNSLIDQDVRTTATPTFQSGRLNATNAFISVGVSDAADMRVAYASNAGAYFSSAVIGDGIIRNVDSTKNIRIGVGSASPQMIISNTAVTTTVGTVIRGSRTTTPTSAGIYLGEGGANDYAIEICATGAANSSYIDFTYSGQDLRGRILYSHNGDIMSFLTGGNNERMRIVGDRLKMANVVANRRISLYDNADNEHQFYGFGVNNGVLRTQLPDTAANNVFYAATSTTTSNEVFRVMGTGGIRLPNSGGLASTLDYYQDGSFSATWVGAFFSNPQVATVFFTRIGKTVHLTFAPFEATAAAESSITQTLATYLPTYLRPTSAQYAGVHVKYNNAILVSSYGLVEILTSGQILFWANAQKVNFAINQVNGIPYRQTVSYTLN